MARAGRERTDSRSKQKRLADEDRRRMIGENNAQAAKRLRRNAWTDLPWAINGGRPAIVFENHLPPLQFIRYHGLVSMTVEQR